VLLQCAANVFGYAPVKNEAKGEKCFVSTGRCKGSKEKAKHDFS
jgi:hypothetical protein